MSLGRSRRGGGSAPQHCRSSLRSCMIGSVQKSGNLKQSASGCMADFNNCRSGGKRKARKTRRRKSRR